MTTFCLTHKSLDPYFNLAAEEYFLKNYREDFFMLWRSKQSIVVGKHQNALAEINQQFVKDNHICVARRLSGGGTVFHDLGNINFTFIRNVNEISEVNFAIFTKPIAAALQKLGVEAYTTGRNDLMIDGKKISGNAEHVFRKRVLHHGTLLFDSNLYELSGALKVDLSRFEDKSVQSNRSPVTNISEYLKEKMNVEEFMEYLFEEVQTSFQDKKIYQITQEDIAAIEKLRDEKYSTWDWVYGYSPKYTFRNSIELPSGKIEVELMVEKGIILEAGLKGFNKETSETIEKMLEGKRHRIEDFNQLLLHSQVSELTPEKLIELLF